MGRESTCDLVGLWGGSDSLVGRLVGHLEVYLKVEESVPHVDEFSQNVMEKTRFWNERISKLKTFDETWGIHTDFSRRIGISA